MKLFQYLQEEYLLSAVSHKMGTFGGSTEVFINPTVKEIQSVVSDSFTEYIRPERHNAVRFIADFDRKKLFVFKVSNFHSSVAKALLIKGFSQKISFWGTAEFKNGKLWFLDSDRENTRRIKYDEKYEDKWTEKWFPGGLIRQFKKNPEN